MATVIRFGGGAVDLPLSDKVTVSGLREQKGGREGEHVTELREEGGQAE